MAIAARNLVPPFSAQHLEGISKVSADTSTGLTGSEIGYLLRDSNISDVDPENTKWKRLLNAFIKFRNEHKAGNHIILFVR